MKNFILAFALVFSTVSTFASELNGAYSNSTTELNINEVGNIVDGTLIISGITYQLAGKVANNIAYIEVINSNNELMGNISIESLPSGEIMVRLDSKGTDFGLALETKLTKR